MGKYKNSIKSLWNINKRNYKVNCLCYNLSAWKYQVPLEDTEPIKKLQPSWNLPVENFLPPKFQEGAGFHIPLTNVIEQGIFEQKITSNKQSTVVWNKQCPLMKYQQNFLSFKQRFEQVVIKFEVPFLVKMTLFC